MDKYNFHKTKYGTELLIDLIRLESLETYILHDPSHVLTYYDITVISEGQGYFHLDDHTYTIRPGEIFFSSPMQVRQWKIDHMPEGLVLIFEEEFLSTFFKDRAFIPNLSFFCHSSCSATLTLSPSEYADLEQILVTIEQEISMKDKKEDHLLRALLYQALAWLNRKYRQTHQVLDIPKNSLVNTFKTLIEKHFAQQRSVSYYAELLSVTPGHLNDQVKKQSGLSAKKMILNRVFLEAKRLLYYSDHTISEIAWKLNFQDCSYFVRAFKNATRLTPMQFRAKANP